MPDSEATPRTYHVHVTTHNGYIVEVQARSGREAKAVARERLDEGDNDIIIDRTSRTVTASSAERVE